MKFQEYLWYVRPGLKITILHWLIRLHTVFCVLWQKTCVYEKVRPSTCFETDSGHVQYYQTQVNISKSFIIILKFFFITLPVFDENVIQFLENEIK